MLGAIAIGATVIGAAIGLPIVIAICVCVGLVCCVIVGAVCYYIGRYQDNADNREQKILKEELRTREKEVRQFASELAEQTAQDADEMRQQAKEQRQYIQESASKLEINVLQIETTTQDLAKTSMELINTAKKAQSTASNITAELVECKLKLTMLNHELQTTKDSLTEKEAELKDVIICLDSTQQALHSNTQKNMDEIEIITQQLCASQELLQTTLSNTDSVKALEVIHLRSDNERLVRIVQQLEMTVNSYKAELNSWPAINKHQFDEITVLHNENKQLTQTITMLSDALESRQDLPVEPKSSVSRGLGLFSA